MKTEISIREITSIDIRNEANKAGVSHVSKLAECGEGDNKITVYQIGGFRAIETNADSIFEENDPAGFAQVLEDFEIDI